jgi:predicted protein tyrosine phosphatase
MFENVIFVSRQVAMSLPPGPDAIMISLIAPGDKTTFAPGYCSILQLAMDDVYEEVFNLPPNAIHDDQSHYTHEWGTPTYQIGLYRMPTLEHARAIANFLAEHEGGCSLFRRVIVHCSQGKSRSSAVAQFVSEKYGTPILNADPAYQDQVAMTDTSRANPRLLRLLKKA